MGGIRQSRDGWPKNVQSICSEEEPTRSCPRTRFLGTPPKWQKESIAETANDLMTYFMSYLLMVFVFANGQCNNTNSSTQYNWGHVGS
jgi:hypothetical protein